MIRRRHRERSAAARAFPGPVLALLCAALLGNAPPTSAEEGPAAEEEGRSAAPTVPLDRLLRLPTGVNYEVETRAGLTRSEWRARFTKLTRERDEAKRALEASQEELSKIASKTDAWNLGTPGTGASAEADDPLNFKLDLQIRRERRELKEAEARLETLKVEANLAEVPKAWREPARETARESTVDEW